MLQPQARLPRPLTPTNTQELTSAPAAITRGLADLVVVKPHRQPDEAFHRTVTEALHDWRRAEPVGPVAVRVVGERWSARSQTIRDRLERNGVSYTFHAADSAEGPPSSTSWTSMQAGSRSSCARRSVLVQPDDSEVVDRMAAPAPAADRLRRGHRRRRPGRPGRRGVRLVRGPATLVSSRRRSAGRPGPAR